MKWALFARLGVRFSRLRAGAGDAEPRDLAAELTADELAEFLDGDLHADGARPEFRERLREDLWELVQELSEAKEPAKD